MSLVTNILKANDLHGKFKEISKTEDSKMNSIGQIKSKHETHIHCDKSYEYNAAMVTGITFGLSYLMGNEWYCGFVLWNVHDYDYGELKSYVLT